MVTHEIAGVLVASLVTLAFITAVANKNSQMASILTSATSGWTNILQGVAGGAAA
jgi:hypothetical protein